MTEGINNDIKSVIPEQNKPREKLSDEQMGNLLSSVGNSEAKAITLILMGNGNVYDGASLHKEILYAQRKRKTWDISSTSLFDYCSKTFSRIGGLVEMRIMNPDLSAYGYAITDKGKYLGIPLAGLLLDFSERHNVSMELFLGATKSLSQKRIVQTGEGEEIEFKKRAPLTTLKIFRELLAEPNLPIKEKDLAERIGEVAFPRSLLRHLRRLSTLGIIEYETIEANKPYVLRKRSSKMREEKLPALTGLIMDILDNNPDRTLTRNDIYDLLSQEEKRKWKEDVLKGHISTSLSFLSKRGYADIGKFNREKHSEINLTDKQRALLTEFLEIIDRFQNQDQEIVEMGKGLAKEIVSDPQKVATLMGRAKEASSQGNRSSQEETLLNILSIISSKPNITNKGIQILLNQDYHKKLGMNSISAFSYLLLQRGDIRAETDGSVSKFYPN